MIGTDKDTGRALSDRDHLKQSIIDILTTRKGSRVMRREYGSDLPFLIDAPFSDAIRVDMIVATAEALQRWEPRYLLQNVEVFQSELGQTTIALTGVYLPTGETINLDGIQL